MSIYINMDYALDEKLVVIISILCNASISALF